MVFFRCFPSRFEALSDDLDETLADKLAQAISETSVRFKDLASQAGGIIYYHLFS